MYTRPNTAAGSRDYVADWSLYEEVAAGDAVVSLATPVSVPAGLVFGAPVVQSPRTSIPISTLGVPPGYYQVRLVATLASGRTLTMSTPSLRVTT